MEPSGKIQSNQGRVRNQYTVLRVLLFQADQRPSARIGEEDKHDEGSVQAAREHRALPQGRRRLRTQGAGPLPGESSHFKSTCLNRDN